MTSPQHTVRKLTVEVVDARDLLPKDGQGTSSPYVVVEFAGQRKRTKTSVRSLNPKWHEKLEFLVPDPADMEAEELDVEVYSDKRQGTSGGGGRKNHFLGRVRIYGSQFAKKGEEGLIYFPLEKRALLSWVRGDIGLRIYYYEEQQQGEEKKLDQSNPQQEHNEAKKESISDIPLPTETASETQEPPPVPLVVVEEVPSPDPAQPPQHVVEEHPREVLMAEVKKMQTTTTMEKTTVSRRTNGGHFEPKAIPGKFSSTREAADRISSAYDLVEPMQFLFVKVVKARNLQPCENPSVKVRAGAQTVRTKQSPGNSANPEWNQVFSFSHTKAESTLEISVWDGGAAAGETFLGGVCFDLSDVPVRDKPDGPLAAQWYRLEGSDDRNPTAHITGDIMVSVWIGTQADEAFPDSWNTEAPHVGHTRSKVYQSPKLWYLRVSVIEAQDLHVGGPSPSPFPVDVRVKIQLGFQSSGTRRSTAGGDSPSFSWHEDLMFVVSEPLDDQLLVLVEDRSGKETTLLGHAMVEVASVEQRLDERPLSSKWFNLDGGKAAAASGGAAYAGRIHMRLCLEGGYHVLDEAAHVCSDFRATAKQLWRPAVGVLELGILGARGLLPMKTKGGGKGSTDAYCVAKYGKKWVRTRTITDSFDPRWNEQYTWQVYDPCTVLTIGVFDNWRMFADLTGERPDYRIGKVRIRLSTLESNRVYTNSYPLLVLLRSGLKKMGEVEVAVRFACPALLPDTCAIYAQPMLPRMHHLRPIGVPQQEALRGAAIKMVAGWLARSEPPLGPEVVRYMLDADSHIWSMRRSKSNWFRIMAVLAWIVGVARWLDDIRRWRNPVTTFLVHLLFLVLVWYPELAAPTGFFYLVLVAAWYRRFRPKRPPGMDVRLSQADAVEPDELDEEFDAVPTGKPEELVRARYDRLRTLAGRVQTVMGDFAAQGERLQALVSWRDPRATRLFVGACSAAGVVLYVVPPKMVAVALGFYFLRHPMFRDPMPPPTLNFFRRLPSLSDRIL